MTEPEVQPFSAEELANRAVAVDFVPSKRRDDHPETRAIMRDWRRWLATLAQRDAEIARMEIGTRQRGETIRELSARIAELEAALRDVLEPFAPSDEEASGDECYSRACQIARRALSPPTGAEVKE